MHQLIGEMEKVYRTSGDTNFKLIIVDFDSSDIDVKKTLEEASLPRYLTGFKSFTLILTRQGTCSENNVDYSPATSTSS